MRSKSAFVFAALGFVCLTGGIQNKHFIGSLRTTDGWALAEREGKLVLERPNNDPPASGALKAAEKLKVWQISAPYLSCEGKHLSIDQAEDAVKVSLSTEKTDSAKWTIEVLSTVRPTTPPKEDPRLKKGRSETKFRLGIFDGRYKGWYLAADGPIPSDGGNSTDQAKPIQLRVVQDPKQALTFHYIDSSYSITHK
jgi:hypothetical protein